MSNWISWRNPAAIIVIVAMLVVAAVASMLAANDLNEASDAQASIGALTRAAADVELAWYQAMGADALAATGQAPVEAEGFYQGAVNLYNEAKAVLLAADITEINQAMAGSDQGLAGMTAAFEDTLTLANGGDIAAATTNHLQAAGAIYNNVDPAVQGLAQVAQAADAQLQSEMNSGATQLRLVSIFSFIFAAFGIAYAGWLVYRRDEESVAVSEESVDIQKAA